MGLISDYLEECRARTSLDEIDPCMLMGQRWGNRTTYKSFRSTMVQYKLANQNSEKETFKKELDKNSVILENMKYYYILTEKSILEAENNTVLQSELITYILTSLKEQLRSSYLGICRLRNSIDDLLGYHSSVKIEDLDTKQVRNNLLQRIIGSTIYYMETGAIVDTSTCRSVINDSAESVLIQRKNI